MIGQQPVGRTQLQAGLTADPLVNSLLTINRAIAGTYQPTQHQRQ